MDHFAEAAGIMGRLDMFPDHSDPDQQAAVNGVVAQAQVHALLAAVDAIKAGGIEGATAYVVAHPDQDDSSRMQAFGGITFSRFEAREDLAETQKAHYSHLNAKLYALVEIPN